MHWQIILMFLLGLSVQVFCHQEVQDTYPHHYNPYSFGYDVEDDYGNKQWRQEKSHNPMEVHGSYGYHDKNGVYREVVYVADKNGFRANIKTNEPGLAGSKDPANVKLESRHPVQGAYTKHSPAGVKYYKSQM